MEQNIQPAEASSQISNVTPGVSYGSYVFTGILVLAALVLGASGMYYYMKSRNVTTQPRVMSNDLGTTVSPNETRFHEKNLIYTNEKFGFQINPKNLTQIKEDQDAVYFTDTKECDITGCNGGIVFVNSLDPKYPNLESIRKREQYVTWIDDITVSGQPAIRGISDEASGQSFAIVIHNGKEYRLAWDIVLDQEILASFKFTR